MSRHDENNDYCLACTFYMDFVPFLSILDLIINSVLLKCEIYACSNYCKVGK